MEKILEYRLRKEIEKLDGKCYKFISPGNAGVPDRVVLLQGRVWFVETKTQNGQLSKMQKVVHRIFKRIGHPVRVIRNYNELNDFIHEIQPAPIPKPRD